MKKMLVLMVVLVLAISAMGCSETSSEPSAYEVAKAFNEDLSGTKAYKMTHQFIETQETMEVEKN